MISNQVATGTASYEVRSSGRSARLRVFIGTIAVPVLLGLVYGRALSAGTDKMEDNPDVVDGVLRPPLPVLHAETSGPVGGSGPGSAQYAIGSRPSVSAEGVTLATYAWVPNVTVKAVVLLSHGFRSHARYNFLVSSLEVGLHMYGESDSASSFIRELVKLGVACHAHDHIGHGASTGLRTFFPSMDALVDDVVAHARDLRKTYRDLPVFMFGHSMGGTVVIRAAQREPNLFAGMMLSSAASEPPQDMLGLKGQMMAPFSALASFLVPTAVVISLPKNTREPHMQKLFESDRLNSMVQLRARVAHEFLYTYGVIAASLADVKVPYLTMSGRYDTLVDPAASTRFYEGTASQDKEVHILDCWHNILIEAGKEESWKRYATWLRQRI